MKTKKLEPGSSLAFWFLFFLILGLTYTNYISLSHLEQEIDKLENTIGTGEWECIEEGELNYVFRNSSVAFLNLCQDDHCGPISLAGGRNQIYDDLIIEMRTTDGSRNCLKEAWVKK